MLMNIFVVNKKNIIMNEQQIKAMVVMSIIDNCTMEINNSGYEQYYINEV